LSSVECRSISSKENEIGSGMKKVVVYTRVSTDEQVENMSLGNQLEACSRYAEAQELEVVKVFREEGESAKTTKRPQLNALLEYCQKHKGEINGLVVWKVDRFSRRTEDHMYVKALLKKSGVSLMSVTEPIEDTVMGRLMETVLSGFAQFDNEVRAERSVGGMVKRLEEGSWPFHAPVGYRNVKDALGRPTIEPSEQGPKVAKWLREFLKGGYTQREMYKMAAQMGISKKSGNPLVYQYTCNMLRNGLYAGVVTSSLINGPRKGLHEPLISTEEFEAIQDILSGKRRQGIVKDAKGEEWPLRGGGFMKCALCSSAITGSNPRGNGGSYPKYSCPKCRRPITGKQVSENKEAVHREFLDRLRLIHFSEEKLSLFREVVLKRWELEYKDARQQRREIDKTSEKLEDEKDELIRNLSKTGQLERSKRVVDKIDRELVALQIQRGQLHEEELDREAIVGYAINFIRDLAKLWEDASPQHKLRFQKMVFPQGITYDFGVGFGTAKLGLCFGIMGEPDERISTLVGPAGLEPATKRL
jgi:site-specific DNA recombinase